jgi:phage shock protein PspC (stress-responsive transcriptional regulator)
VRPNSYPSTPTSAAPARNPFLRREEADDRPNSTRDPARQPDDSGPAYVDILNFYKPGVLDGILDGLVWRFDISATLLTIFLVSVSIPAVMVILSLTLPARVNRAANLVVAALLIPYSAFNAAGATWEWAAFYGISIGIEVLLLAFILRSARTWPRTRSDAAELAPADLPR